jgi:CRISPR-associated protein Csb1
MANHLEATTWDTASAEPTTPVAALPYVRVVDANGEFLTSSRLEAHRVAAAYILDGKIDDAPTRDVLRERFGLAKGKPLDMRHVAREVFTLDPLSLIHGVFFAQSAWPWQPKIARAMTSFVEASDVRAAISGGVKKDSVHNVAVPGRSSAEGYGMVPHSRVEYTAAAIRLYAVIDEQQIASYGLSGPATELLSALAWWELARMCDSGFRLRTACDLVIADSSAAAIPDLAEATTRLSAAIEAVRGELGNVTEVVWTDSKKGDAAPAEDK